MEQETQSAGRVCRNCENPKWIVESNKDNVFIHAINDFNQQHERAKKNNISLPAWEYRWFFETEDEAIALACEIKKAYEECGKEQENVNPESLIMQYCWSGNLEKVISLLDSGCNIEGDSATSFEASTPLLYACVSKNMQLVKTLIERGANIHATDYIGNGVLMYSHNADLLRLFIEDHKLDPNKQHGISKYTPLMNACRFGYIDSMDYLLSIGVNPLLRDHSGAQALQWAMECDGNREGNRKIENYFLDRLAFYKKSHETAT